MHETQGRRPDILIPTDKMPQVRGYEYPPFTIVRNPDIQQAHELFLSHASQMDNLSAARWLCSLTQLNSDAKLPFGNRFYNFSDNSPLNTPELQQIDPTTGLLIYTSSKLEQMLRLQRVSTPEGTDNGISMMLSSELAQLSGAYRSRYALTPERVHYLDIAHSLATYALRFKAPDGHGYSQSLGHWLHLPVSVYERSADKFDHYEEVLKLSLALEEVGYGPQNTYVPLLVRDLKRLYELQGRTDDVEILEEHYKDIPSVKDEIEKAWQKEYDLNRKKRMEEQAAQQPKRRKRRRR